MTDHLTPDQRSENMSRIRSVNTKPELTVRKYLYEQGFRYRIHNKTLPGKPDISNKSRKTAVFVHGCFWHQHDGCSRATMPKTNKKYWKEKLKKNRQRFNEVLSELSSLRYRVLVIWECEVKVPDNLDRLYRDICDHP